jgi:hypothetical protein
MQESGKKAYEIGYALFRIAAKTGNIALRDSLERNALALLDTAITGDNPAMGNTARGLETILRFGGDVGILHPANVDTIIAELRLLNPAIAGMNNPAKIEEVDLGDIFKRQEPLFTERIRQHEVVESESGNPAIKSEVRQSAILERIRQSGNCRLRDIQEVLPDLSERTIRYDLQSLVEQNLVEKVGTGGPSVFYRIRQAA